MVIHQVTTGHSNIVNAFLYYSSEGDFGQVTEDDGKYIKVRMMENNNIRSFLRCQVKDISVKDVAQGNTNILCAATDYLAAWKQVTIDQGWYNSGAADEMCEQQLKELQEWAS